MKWMASLIGLALSCGAATAADWVHVGGDAGGAKYSPLDEIDRTNVGDLDIAWTYRHGDFAAHPEQRRFAGFHVTPILLPAEAGGHLMLCTPLNRLVALDPATGTERWSFDPKLEFADHPARLKCLGVAYWRDPLALSDAPCAHRIFSGTGDRRVIAVDARDGRPCTDFGVNGQVDVNPIIAATQPAPDDLWGVQFSAPPVVVGDRVVFGMINNMKNLYAEAASGAIRAFDARSGALAWSFDPVPRDPQDPAAVDWTEEARRTTGGGNAWSLLSVDEGRDLVFVPTSSASPNFFGGTRPGDNRYANSVVALRGATGEVVWHFQTIHHDVWDWDMPAQPMLVDLPHNGAVTPAVITVTKQGFVFAFHRETGAPLFEIEERPVPQDGVPGETLSPTQPFPVRPPPLIEGGIAPEDAWGLTRWDRAACRAQIEQARHGPIFTPPSTEGWIMYPGSAGGMNWGGGAFDPDRNLLVTDVSHVGLWLQLLPRAALEEETGFDPSVGAPMGRPGLIQGTDYAISQRIFLGPLFVPCTAPPWSTLAAVDMADGTIKWQVPFGLIDKLSPVPLPLEWGTPLAGGPIVTGGGLVFIGATGDARFRAFDIETGERLWMTELPTSAHATPMTYAADGRQYVVVAAGGHMFIDMNAIDDYLIAFALPDRD